MWRWLAECGKVERGTGEDRCSNGAYCPRVRAVLGRQHHGVDAVRFAVHVAHGDLALGVRAQKGQAAIFSQLRLAFHKAVGVINGRGHQLGRFVAGITKHQALVAGAGVEVVVTGVINTLGNVVALLVVG